MAKVDARRARSAARGHLRDQYGTNIINVTFTRTWYSTGAKMDVWEVAGDVTLKRGIMGKETRHFKYQIDPTTGVVIGMQYPSRKGVRDKDAFELLKAIAYIIMGLIMLGLAYVLLRILL